MTVLPPDLSTLVLLYLFDLTSVEDTKELQTFVGVHKWTDIQLYVLSWKCPHNVKLEFWMESCGGGNLQFCMQLAEKLELVPISVNAGFHKACENGHIEIVQWMHAAFDLSRIYAVPTFENVCKNGHLTVAKWMQETYSMEWNYSAFVKACSNGHFHVMKWMVEKLIPLSEMNQLTFGLERACALGNIEICKWIVNIANIKDVRNCTLIVCLHAACSNGHLLVARWIHDYFVIANKKSVAKYVSKSSYTTDAFLNACGKGYLDVAQWICQTYGSRPSIMLREAFHSGCVNGRLKIVKWIHGTYWLPTSKRFWKDCFVKASYNGHFSTCVWLSKRFDFEPMLKASKQSFFYQIDQHPHLVRWLLKTFPFLKYRDDDFTYQQFVYLCGAGDLENVQEMYKTYPCISNLDARWVSIAFSCACEKGQLHIVERFMEIYKIASDIMCVGFVRACDYGQLHIVEWFASRVDFFQLRSAACSLGLKKACKQRHLHIVRWLINTFHIKRQDWDDKEIQVAMTVACLAVDLEMMQLIAYTFNFTAQDNLMCYTNAFQRACERGRLEAAQWIGKQLPDDGPSGDLKKSAFLAACENGHLLVAKWLETAYHIDKKDKEVAATVALDKHQLHVAKWLSFHSLGLA